MNIDDGGSEQDLRQRLRRELATQRSLIASQLAVASAPDQFPRSMTMRLLTRQPALAGKLALLLAARLGGSKRIAIRLGAAGIAAWLVRTALQRMAHRADPDRLPHD